MYCPKCKTEYVEGITECKDCKVPLMANTNENDVEDNTEIAAIKPVKLTSVANELEAKMLLSYLQSYGISCYKIDAKIGGYMNIYMGYSIFGEDIYVDGEEYDIAADLLKSMADKNLEESENELNVQEDYESNSENIPFFKNKTLVARIVLTLAIISTVLCIVIQ
ncbi:hypothetical protein [Anaerosporobacter sp.]